VRVSSISHNNTFIPEILRAYCVHASALHGADPVRKYVSAEIIDATRSYPIHNTLGWSTDPVRLVPEVTCAADFNNDGFVGASDMLIFLGAYGCVGACGAPDLNNDGFVNTTDLARVFLGAYGAQCN
jgi:hypothetical protein